MNDKRDMQNCQRPCPGCALLAEIPEVIAVPLVQKYEQGLLLRTCCASQEPCSQDTPECKAALNQNSRCNLGLLTHPALVDQQFYLASSASLSFAVTQSDHRI